MILKSYDIPVFDPKTLQLEIFDNEITIYLFLREGEPAELIERKLIATAEAIKLMDVSSGDYTSFTPISIDAKFIISFIAESGNQTSVFC